MPIYNKLVRDLIPEIIIKSGSTPITRILDPVEYHQELRTKLKEEMNEYFTANTNEESIEELADIMELLHALAASHGSSHEELEKIRAKKADKRGGFNDRIYLIEVQDA